MKLCVFTISLAALLGLGHGCSCVSETSNRPRSVAIVDSFTSSSMIYTARVTEARCNCYDDLSPTALTCLQYSPTAGEVEAQVLAMGTCYGPGSLYAIPLTACSQLNSALSVDPADVMPAAGGETLNLTGLAQTGLPGGNSCPYTCQFNIQAAGEQFSEYSIQPCQYTVEVVEVFKSGSDIMVADNIDVFGPDVQTSCGQIGRILDLGETYLVGVGGACDSIGEWSTLDSYSDAEIMLLRQLGGGAVTTLPSLLLLALVSIMALSL